MFRLFSMAWLWLQIRSLEATAQGQNEVIELVRDPETLEQVCYARINTMAEIDRLKAEYRRVRRGDGVRAMTARVA